MTNASRCRGVNLPLCPKIRFHSATILFFPFLHQCFSALHHPPNMANYSMATHSVGTYTMENPYIRAPVQGTAADDMDMRRMRKPQELNVSLPRIHESQWKETNL